MKDVEQYTLNVDKINTPEESIKVLYLLAQKANKAGILDINESYRIHSSLVFYAELINSMKTKNEDNKEQLITG